MSSAQQIKLEKKKFVRTKWSHILATLQEITGFVVLGYENDRQTMYHAERERDREREWVQWLQNWSLAKNKQDSEDKRFVYCPRQQISI